jgi:hypothetical protein
MSTVKVTGGFSKVISDLVQDNLRELLTLAGAEGLKSIQGETRRGNNLLNEDGKVKLKPLENSTVRSRTSLARYNDTHPVFSPKRSNLTITGQLLDALEYSVQGNKVTITVQDSRRTPYQGRGGPHQGNPPTNRDVAIYQAEMGRDFVQIDNQTLGRIRRLLTQSIRRILSRR